MTADDAIGHAALDQRLLDGVGLGVGAVQHRKVGVTPSPRHTGQDGLSHVFALFLGVVHRHQIEGVALGVGGPQGLALAALVLGNDGVGGVQNTSRGAVVLLQTDDAAMLKLLLK